jgi:hypothetical protein
MIYMRIERNKFWGWVLTALLIGIVLASVVAYALGGSTRSELAALRAGVSGSGVATSSADLQAQLQSTEATVSALMAQNSALAAQLTAAQAQLKTGKKTTTTPSASSTGTISFVQSTVTPAKGGSITSTGTVLLLVRLYGPATKVTVRVTSASGSFDQTYNLAKVSVVGTRSRWTATVPAPSGKGSYRARATAFIGSKGYPMSGTTPFTVK